ncbi:MAG TPA: DUF6659 family protein [Nitrososphaeraceae archaeon]|jgi:hypothetical protein|nr:DUF6659 family protein [Nitrososphaeraceae archaeon]
MNYTDEEKLKENKKLCRQFLELSPKIRYVGLMNDFGRTVSGQLRKDVIPMFSPDEARDENFLEATRNQLRKKFEKAIGKTRFTITENEKVKIVTIPINGGFFYITLEEDAENQEILKIIKSIMAHEDPILKN